MTVAGVPPRPRSQAAKSSRAARKLRHLLLLNDKCGKRAVSLNAALHSVGSASDNAIVLESDSAADLHALFIRVPDPKTPGGYRYRLVSGRASGFDGTSPFAVNGKKCSSRDLRSGDRIWFGKDTKVSYHVAALTDEELAAHVHPASYRRVKSATTSSTEFNSLIPAVSMSELMADFSEKGGSSLR